MYGLIGTAAFVVSASGRDLDQSLSCKGLSEFPCVAKDSTTLPAIIKERESFAGDGIFGALVGILSRDEKHVIAIHGKTENYLPWRSEIVSYSIRK